MMAIIYLLGCATVFGAFIWATKGHFKQGTKTIPTYLIYLFSVATFVCGMAALFLQPLSVWRMGLGTLVSLLGAALFFWTVYATRTRGLYLAYAREKPRTLVYQGPYAIVRHPFYLAYLLFWLGMVVTAPWWPTLACLLALLCLYMIAARGEESKFEETEFAEVHQQYKANVSFLTPNPWRIIHRSFVPNTFKLRRG